MQTARMVQAVILMMIVAMAASCAASKDYAKKLFNPDQPVTKDSQNLSVRFLDLDDLEPDKNNWVKTDIINGPDTTNKTLALDNLSEQIPAVVKKGVKDTLIKSDKAVSDPVAKSTINSSSTRQKKVREE